MFSFRPSRLGLSFITVHYNRLLDVLVWSNQRVIRWLQAIGLREFSSQLSDSGIHGAVIAFDNTFDADTLALALQIPNQNVQVCSCSLISISSGFHSYVRVL